MVPDSIPKLLFEIFFILPVNVEKLGLSVSALSAITNMKGRATSMTARVMWKAREIPIWERAAKMLLI
jgi:hypothetical protein